MSLLPAICAKWLAEELAQEVLYLRDMTHLTAIETRQKKSAVRDLVFAAFVGLGAFVSVSALTTAVAAASTLAQR